MKRDDVHLSNDPATTLVLSRGTRIVLLQIEPYDDLQKVFETLHSQEHPVLLALSERGNVLKQDEHFLALRSQINQTQRPPLLHLIIPDQCVREKTLATRWGFQHSTSKEEALQFLSFSLPQAHLPLSRVTEPHVRLPPSHIPGQGRQDQPQSPHPTPVSSPARGEERLRRPFLAIAVLLVVLLAASALLLPLMLAPTQSQSHPAAVTTVGTLAFSSSGQVDPAFTQGYNDLIMLNLDGLPPPQAGNIYFVWLMPDPSNDETPPLLIGTLHKGQTSHITLTYASPNHSNLLASYSGVRIIEQAERSRPSLPSQDPITWRWEGWIPDTSAPGDENQYSLLDHLRHLIAKDPTLSANNLPGGLALWMTRNVAKVEEWASAAQGQWHGAQTSQEEADLIHRHFLRMLAYLDGQFYYSRDVPAGSPWLVDEQSGKIGLINRMQNQNPPAYLEHVNIHLNGLANAPGHEKTQQQLAIQIDGVITKMESHLQHVRQDASALAKMDTAQLRQPETLSRLNEMARLTTEAKSGWLDPQTGENIGGVLWITARLQQLAVISVHRVEQG